MNIQIAAKSGPPPGLDCGDATERSDRHREVEVTGTRCLLVSSDIARVVYARSVTIHPDCGGLGVHPSSPRSVFISRADHGANNSPWSAVGAYWCLAR